MRGIQRELDKRRRSLEEQEDAHLTPYKRFRRQIFQRNVSGRPAASTPVAAELQWHFSFELDAVRQRLELDSPVKHPPAQTKPPGNQGWVLDGRAPPGGTPENCPITGEARGRAVTAKAPKQEWLWKPSRECGRTEISGPCESGSVFQPFAVLSRAGGDQQGEPEEKLAAPGLQDDYYTDPMDCSRQGILALALGSSVCIRSSDGGALLGRLEPRSSGPGGRSAHAGSVLSVRWNPDGRVLCIGTRRGEVLLWDVEQRQTVRFLSSDPSAVRALSWKNQLLSSGSALGRIAHHDPRAADPLVGVAVQEHGVCSLQWAPGDDWLASGSMDGVLRIWSADAIGLSGSRRPVSAMKQPSAVKAMGWCPWQRQIIATGGGWKDGQLRIWDAHSATCVTATDTNSQICSLRWAAQKKGLVTGHGLPHHHAVCWDWDFPRLRPDRRLAGHSRRVLCLATSHDCAKIFSAGADERLNIWRM